MPHDNCTHMTRTPGHWESAQDSDPRTGMPSSAKVWVPEVVTSHLVDIDEQRAQCMRCMAIIRRCDL